MSKDDLGFLITRIKEGAGLRLVMPDGSVGSIEVIRAGQAKAEILIKVPDNIQIRKFNGEEYASGSIRNHRAGAK